LCQWRSTFHVASGPGANSSGPVATFVGISAATIVALNPAPCSDDCYRVGDASGGVKQMPVQIHNSHHLESRLRVFDMADDITKPPRDPAQSKPVVAEMVVQPGSNQVEEELWIELVEQNRESGLHTTPLRIS
jgi:hypothetical protein